MYLFSDPHLVMYTSDCKKGSGFYKCDIFIQFAGSPVTEMVKSEIFFNSTICKFCIKYRMRKVGRFQKGGNQKPEIK